VSDEASGFKAERKKVSINALKMASGTMTSRVLGFLRDMALAAFFDRTVTDAWTTAFRLPNLFRRLFGEGSLAVSFIPVFIDLQVKDPSGVRARNLVNAFYTLLMIFLATFTVLGVWGMRDILHVLLHADYSLVPGKFELTLRMARLMFSFVFFVCTYAYMAGLLNALGSFALPALAPALFNVAVLAFTLMPPSWFLHRGDGLALGVAIGGMLQAAILWPMLKAKNYLPEWNFLIWSADIREVLRRLLPGLMGLGLLQFMTLLNLHFASHLPEGSISSVYWADRLLELPLSLVAVSIGTALLPRLSELWSQGDKGAVAKTTEDSFLLNIYLAWPAALGLFFLAEPIIEVLFKRGHFTGDDVMRTSNVLQVYAVTLLFMSSVRVLIPAYYAAKNTWAPALFAGAGLLLHVFLAPRLMANMGLQGLVISALFSALLNLVLLVAFLPKLGVSLSWRGMLPSLLKIVAAGVLLVVGTQIYWGLSAVGLFGNKLLQTAGLSLAILVGAVGYFYGSVFLGLPQSQKFLALLRQKRGKSLPLRK